MQGETAVPKIREVQIKRFRSINEITFIPNDLSVIVGDNDCGKSNVLRALNLFFNGHTDPGEKFDFATGFNRHIVTPEKTAPQIEVIVELNRPGIAGGPNS